MVPFEPEELGDLGGVRVLIIGGKEDMLIPRENTERLAEMLSDAGAEVTAHFTDAGHALTNTELVLAKRWLLSLGAVPPAATNGAGSGTSRGQRLRLQRCAAPVSSALVDA